MCGTASWDAWAYLWKERYRCVIWEQVTRRLDGLVLMFCLIILPCVVLKLLDVEFVWHFPSTEVELLHAALSRGSTSNFYPGILSKRDLEPLVFGERHIFPPFFSFLRCVYVCDFWA